MNKKLIVTVGLAAVVVLSLVLVSAAFAQGQTPPTLAPGYGPGMMGGQCPFDNATLAPSN